jgi:hypothetical protein
LFLGEFYNHLLVFDANSRLKKLELNKKGKFNQELDFLPQSLTSLRVGGDFTWPLDHLPLSLTFLQVGRGNFSHSLDSLPESLRVLKLGLQYVHPIARLPANLSTLRFTREQANGVCLTYKDEEGKELPFPSETCHWGS